MEFGWLLHFAGDLPIVLAGWVGWQGTWYEFRTLLRNERCRKQNKKKHKKHKKKSTHKAKGRKKK